MRKSVSFWGYGFWVFLCTALGTVGCFLWQAATLAQAHERYGALPVNDSLYEFPSLIIGSLLGYGFSTITVILVRLLQNKNTARL